MSILCMPISNYEGEVIGVAQIINKAGNGIFTVEDERVRKCAKKTQHAQQGILFLYQHMA